MMSRERKGKRQLWYEHGRKTNCDYNNYNDYFIILCWRMFKTLTIDNINGIIRGIKEGLSFLFNLIMLILILIITPVSIPVMVLLNKRRLFKEYGNKIKCQYKE